MRRNFKKLRKVLIMAKKKGKYPINKKYSVVTKLYQPYINMEVNQIDIDDIIFNIDKKALILEDGFWLKIERKTYIFVGNTALCVYVHLKYVGMDQILQQLYGKRELTEEEKEELLKIRYS